MSRRMLRPLAALALAALIGAGCSKTSTAGAGDNAAANHDKAVKFAACMRDNGVKGFPDPDASGTFTVDGVLNGSSLNPDSAEWKKALDACKDLQPAGFTGGKRTAEQQAQVLKFAACMRDNGVRDFPDPGPADPIIDTNRIPSLAGKDVRSDPVLRAAQDKCGDLVAGIVQKGRP
ncbi:hypothetical protein ODJ79_10995 [Actinoplanes sp. KI2]|uniref:hypothetical protein n=1 Tax=Actinoplanes sp. KI2 TaxID=2983315 RepID=UPI0021D58C70|nr:hypothetical protein [Actinoplanes sp. KI2]MCU7724242.1 hypothetical protein [Actinoplanes sp. KI2]